jgi:kynurenine formamidase
MALWHRLAQARIIDLGHPFHRGMPVSPNHPPFQMAMLRRHGDMVREDGGSAANEIIVAGGHVGTHLDAIGHVSHDGLVHGGRDAASIQSHEGLSALGIDEVDPIICRGALLDVPTTRGVDALDAGEEVTVDDLEEAADRAGVIVGAGDAVLIRTGWSIHWNDPAHFTGQQAGAPGPGVEAAGWLVDRGVRVAGAETLAFEHIPPRRGHSLLPVHRMLLVEAGIHIIEAMDLSGLAAAAAGEFTFVAVPLKLIGATGSPVRPLAILDG